MIKQAIRIDYVTRLYKVQKCLPVAVPSPQANTSGNLADLALSSGAATIHPSDNAILSVLQARLYAGNLVVVNAYKTLAHVNNIFAKEYGTRTLVCEL